MLTFVNSVSLIIALVALGGAWLDSVRKGTRFDSNEKLALFIIGWWALAAVLNLTH